MKNGSRFIAILVLTIVIQSCNDMKEPLVIGHRGAMGHETENTLASIQKALNLGVDMIEIDVFKITSGETVVFHDETVNRLTNGGGNIEEYEIEELRKLIVQGNHKIPLLQDVLELINNKVRLNIELKGADTADSVNAIVNHYVEQKEWVLDNFIISSFRWGELKRTRELNTIIPIAILTSDNPLDGLPIAKELNAEAINPNYRKLNLEIAKEIQNAGFKVYPWTVNEPEDIARMKQIGVDGIITNYPERVN
ncbi:glycerophosphodiester phosphodiesterase [Ulvibacterium marinum]|uniref:Glycerophosphodiester phosphodiesterase n=2 Tax=Ulvibacterium marinum TaxID=2419782 RepID=A0A3B0CF30_9FLAO|nr:glycerophosphodiester phosphodiesterase [Ulvibacterium marinum]